MGRNHYAAYFLLCSGHQNVPRTQTHTRTENFDSRLRHQYLARRHSSSTNERVIIIMAATRKSPSPPPTPFLIPRRMFRLGIAVVVVVDSSRHFFLFKSYSLKAKIERTYHQSPRQELIKKYLID